MTKVEVSEFVLSGNALIFDAVVLQIRQGTTAKALAVSVDPVYSCWVFSAVLGQLASRFELALIKPKEVEVSEFVFSGNAKIFDTVVLQILQGATAKALAASVDPVYSCWVFSAVLGKLASRFVLAQLFAFQEAEAVVETIETDASYELDCQDEDFPVDSGDFTADQESPGEPALVVTKVSAVASPLRRSIRIAVQVLRAIREGKALNPHSGITLRRSKRIAARVQRLA